MHHRATQYLWKSGPDKRKPQILVATLAVIVVISLNTEALLCNRQLSKPPNPPACDCLISHNLVSSDITVHHSSMSKYQMEEATVVTFHGY